MAWHIFTTFCGGGVPQIVYMILSIIYERRNPENIVILANLASEFTIMNFLKMMHAQERPFWVYSAIKPDASCIEQFGNPSGHSLFSAFFSMYLWHRHVYCHRKDEEEQSPGLKAFKIISFIICTGGWITIGISRMEVGVHSLNQVLYGWQLGLWTALCCINFIDPKVREWVEHVKNGGSGKNGLIINGTLSILGIIATSLAFWIQYSKGRFDLKNTWK